MVTGVEVVMGTALVAFIAGFPYGQVVTELEVATVADTVEGASFCCEAGMGMLTFTVFLGGGIGAFTDTGAFLTECGAGAMG